MKRKKTLFTTSSPTLLASFSLMDISMLTVAKVQNVPELWMYHWVGMDVFEKEKKKSPTAFSWCVSERNWQTGPSRNGVLQKGRGWCVFVQAYRPCATGEKRAPTKRRYHSICPCLSMTGNNSTQESCSQPT